MKNSTRTIHESDIIDGLTKAKFKIGKISAHYQIDRRDTIERYKPTIEDPGHNDLHVQRREAAKLILHLIDAPEDWKESATVLEMKQDLKTLELTFKVEIHFPWTTKPFIINTPKLNDLTFADVEPLMREVAKFVTGEKRSQQEMFAEA